MRMGKYGHELDLILLLTENRSYTAQDIADRLGITRRNLYNYFEYLRFSGFKLLKSGAYYRLDRSSPFLRKLGESMTVSREEAAYILQTLTASGHTDFYAHSIRQKLVRHYNLADVRSPEVLTAISQNATQLKAAMVHKTMCVLHDYSSPHSHSVSDRIVEPFLFMNNGLDIRCHEIRSHANKTFKLARIGSVELLDVPWIAEDKHKQVFTDIFMFSGEQRFSVRLLMGQLARNLMVEEYPSAETCITPAADGKWLFAADVASYLGVGRFVLGLYRDIQVLGDGPFAEYVSGEIAHMAATWGGGAVAGGE